MYSLSCRSIYGDGGDEIYIKMVKIKVEVRSLDRVKEIRRKRNSTIKTSFPEYVRGREKRAVI